MVKRLIRTNGKYSHYTTVAYIEIVEVELAINVDTMRERLELK